MQVKPLSKQEFDNNINSTKKRGRELPTPATVQASVDPSSFKIDQDVFVVSSEPNDPAFARHTLPSRGFFYQEKKDIVFRAFRVGDLKKIQHFLTTNNITHLIDAIQNCVESGTDVRDLTFDDFLFIVFRIVFDSHPNPEYKFIWNSFYGNDGEETITPSNLDIQELDYKTLLKEIPDFKEINLTPCLVRSYEVLHNNRHKEDDETTWDPEKTWLYEEVGSFLNEATLEEQLARAENLSAKSSEYKKIKLFKKLSKHSIKMELKVRDKKFVPEEALKVLKERVTSLEAVREEEPEVYEGLAKNEMMNIEDLNKEILRIETSIAEGKEVRAREELTPFRLSLPGLIKPLFA